MIRGYGGETKDPYIYIYLFIYLFIFIYLLRNPKPIPSNQTKAQNSNIGALRNTYAMLVFPLFYHHSIKHVTQGPILINKASTLHMFAFRVLGT